MDPAVGEKKSADDVAGEANAAEAGRSAASVAGIKNFSKDNLLIGTSLHAENRSTPRSLPHLLSMGPRGAGAL
ncbi:hypothetical protein GCM10008179_17260 [Hansschlegelia plantiphila]|uniref:Uncharacterized protein n=1 Tax=Hansschlegelia plantiphila TaxID=374655 RepID=A0A9W6J1M9_9HYPH|nr:hypothetical protein GCM10008179_17260 [Hansschlegelia plantiphila]